MTVCDLEWPEIAHVPESIGEGRVYDHDNNPCCSLGQYIKATGHQWGAGDVRISQWRKAFCACADVLGFTYSDNCGGDGVGNRNDRMTPDERLQVYAASWLYLGVPIDREVPGARELSEKAKGI